MSRTLNAQKPTAEEVAAAESILAASGNKENAKAEFKKVSSNFAYWLKTCNDVTEQERHDAQTSRGEVRLRLLKQFLALQVRARKGKQTTTTETVDDKLNKKDVLELGREGVLKLLRPIRGQKLMDAKAFDIKPCPFTGRTDDPDLVIYLVPQHYVQYTSGEKNGTKTSAE